MQLYRTTAPSALLAKCSLGTSPILLRKTGEESYECVLPFPPLWREAAWGRYRARQREAEGHNAQTKNHPALADEHNSYA